LGWAYLVEWYGVFGLDLETLDLSVYLMLVASLSPIIDLIGKLLPAGEIIGFLIFCAVALLIFSETFYVRRLTRGTLTTKHRRWLRKSLGELSDSGNKIIVPPSSPLPTLQDRLSVATLSWLRKALYPPLFLLVILLLIVFAHWVGKKEGKLEYQEPSTKITLGFKKDEIQLFDKELVSANQRGEIDGGRSDKGSSCRICEVRVQKSRKWRLYSSSGQPVICSQRAGADPMMDGVGYASEQKKALQAIHFPRRRYGIVTVFCCDISCLGTPQNLPQQCRVPGHSPAAQAAATAG